MCIRDRVFPALDLILVTAFFVKAGTTYYEYRKHGQIEWTGLILLFAGLVLSLTAPLYLSLIHISCVAAQEKRRRGRCKR